MEEKMEVTRGPQLPVRAKLHYLSALAPLCPRVSIFFICRLTFSILCLFTANIMAAEVQGTGTSKAVLAETTPLLPKSTETPPASIKTPFFQPITWIMICGLIVSLSFGVTQVPLVYVFRVMSCQAYYDTHFNTPLPSNGNRCSVPEIEANTAFAISILSASTTFFGVANLFITGQWIKRYGVKSALTFQVFWPAARLAVQNVGVTIGGSTGIMIVQLSQIMTIVGGPVGYYLVLNTYVANVTEDKERTGALGRLQGYCMFGSSLGFLAGGVLADAFTIITPFQVTLVLFCLCTVYVRLALPYIAPNEDEKASNKGATVIRRALGPLKTLAPAKFVLQNGQIQTEYGPLILAAGLFIAVLATGYIPTLLQMYATDIFDFGTQSNSILVSSSFFLRGLFLVGVFPRIITYGRNVLKNRRHARAAVINNADPQALERVLSTEQGREGSAIQNDADLDVMAVKPDSELIAYDFDLVYMRFSLLMDGIITCGAAFVSQGWQMYLIGALLPLGAGTSSSAKGVILQMCPASERTDALSAISLVEMVARLSTTFVFGLIFAAFASMEKTYLVFVCNAAVALLGFLLLLFSRFPPEGSTRLEAKTIEERNEDGTAREGNGA